MKLARIRYFTRQNVTRIEITSVFIHSYRTSFHARAPARSLNVCHLTYYSLRISYYNNTEIGRYTGMGAHILWFALPSLLGALSFALAAIFAFVSACGWVEKTAGSVFATPIANVSFWFYNTFHSAFDLPGSGTGEGFHFFETLVSSVFFYQMLRIHVLLVTLTDAMRLPLGLMKTGSPRQATLGVDCWLCFA